MKLSKLQWALRLAVGVTLVSSVAVWLAILPQEQALRSDLAYGLLFMAVGGAAASLVLLALNGRRRWRWLWLLPVPLLIFPLVIGVFLIPAGSPVAMITLADGRVLHLNIQNVPTDTIYDLWIDHGLTWQRVDVELEYSEDGRFINDEKLALSRGGRCLFVGRGGIWTDCLEINAGFAPCNLGLARTWWGDKDFEVQMRENSVKMAVEMRGP